MPALQPPHHDSLEAFYKACGVTVHLYDTPQNRFAEPEPEPEREPEPAARVAAAAARPSRNRADDAPAPPAAPAVHTGEGAETVDDAREMARTAPTLETLHAALKAFDACPLKATARQTCVGEGPLGAALMFVGEAPGRDEDAAGRPFVGRSGQLLEKMIAAIGLSRGDVYISNVIPWRPPANRTPTPIETATCEVFIRREIALVAPKILVPLGGPAAKLLLRTSEGIVRQRGRWTRYEDAGVDLDALAMFHPAYLLRTPGEKRRAWQDLLALRERLESVHGLPAWP